MSAGRKILIVEDNVMLRETYVEIVRLLGHEIVGVEATGRGAVEAARRHSPDLVFMDIALDGGMTGIEAAESITEHRALPIIFISGFSDEKVRGRLVGIPNYRLMMKPIDFDELRSVVCEMLNAGATPAE